MKKAICSCITTTPMGIKYHPTLKSVYERSGPEGKLKRVGFKCPNCGTFHDLDGTVL